MLVRFSSKCIGRFVKVDGRESEIVSILASKDKFRIRTGEGQPVIDYTFNDIEQSEELFVSIDE